MIQPLRGTKDILPNEILIWQYFYKTVHEILSIANYNEIRTPIIENTELFLRSIGNDTDIINKEMYTFKDQGERNITLRPEGTASIVRALIHNKLYSTSNISRLWYFGPMFRYERPQQGRQRQFHQLGIECIGIQNPAADVEVIRLAIKILDSLNFNQYKLEINSIGNIKERKIYTEKLISYLNKYKEELDEDSRNRLKTNPLRILDSKNNTTQKILVDAPKLKSCLESESLEHFYKICEHLKYLEIPYKINEKLVRGLDYYNYTAFEIKSNKLSNQNTICGGGRYDKLIEQLGGPCIPSVGWAIGIERLLLIIEDSIIIKEKKIYAYIALQGNFAREKIWKIIKVLEINKINYELDLSENSLKKQLKRANLMKVNICFILRENEIKNNQIIIKWLETGKQNEIELEKLEKYILEVKNLIIT
uniref:Histidine--tRNA ligase, chloroplastic n=1 Tax=Thuretia quercifolia TaxID=189650 RepID=A0A1Z1MKB4_9FLOR|nr:Histidine-tRNA ligase [Thuretia quercifolia]ARW66517.1 Histidine-tRNA ligase [Thuretia quercifolia]